eukprot:174830-Amphidinium_carterae.1
MQPFSLAWSVQSASKTCAAAVEHRSTIVRIRTHRIVSPVSRYESCGALWSLIKATDFTWKESF